jgi:hypothetical protein
MAQLYREKIDIGNRNCLICKKEISLANVNSYIKVEGAYTKRSKIWKPVEGQLRHYLIYANICNECFRHVNASPDGVREFKQKWDKRVDMFRDRLI